MSAQARVVERYTMNQDGSRLDYTCQSPTRPTSSSRPSGMRTGAGCRAPCPAIRVQVK